MWDNFEKHECWSTYTTAPILMGALNNAICKSGMCEFGKQYTEYTVIISWLQFVFISCIILILNNTFFFFYVCECFCLFFVVVVINVSIWFHSLTKYYWNKVTMLKTAANFVFFQCLYRAAYIVLYSVAHDINFKNG